MSEVLLTPAPSVAGSGCEDRLHPAAFDLADLKDTRVAILFWASWCDPVCLDALDDITAAAASHPEVTFLTVLTEDRREDAQAVLAERGIDLLTIEPQGLAPSADDSPWGVMGVPHLVLVERDGTVVLSEPGFGRNPIGPTYQILLRDAGW